MLTFNEIREIIKMIDQSSIQHFELNQDGTQIVIGKYAVYSHKNKTAETDGTKENNLLQTTTFEAKDNLSYLPVTEVEVKSLEILKENKDCNLQKIMSPTVGTFYSAPEPGADPFVKVGQQVSSNTIVCVLEAMKLFNEVEAGVRGEIVEILFKDGEFVEYGAPLFLVKPE